MAVDIRKPLKKYSPILVKAKTDNLNEADTVQRVVKVFEDVLGYDALEEVTREAAIKDKYCDLGIKIDGTIRLLVEVKSASTTLRERHIDQAKSYAANSNLRWVLLTNGVQWILYHLTFEEGIDAVQAFDVDVEQDVDAAAEKVALLHKQSISRGALDEYWQQKSATSPVSIGNALFTEPVLMLIRREIRRREGLLIDVEDLGAALHGMFSTEAREQIGPFKIRRKRARRAPGDPQGAEKKAEPVGA